MYIGAEMADYCFDFPKYLSYRGLAVSLKEPATVQVTSHKLLDVFCWTHSLRPGLGDFRE